MVPCFPLLGLTPSGLFMGLSSTIIYISELILCSTRLLKTPRSLTVYILNSDMVELNESNVMGVWYLAKKYIVPSLADKCIKYLQTGLNSSNVFSILPQAQKFEEKNLVDQCWKVIDKQTEEAVKSREFVAI